MTETFNKCQKMKFSPAGFRKNELTGVWLKLGAARILGDRKMETVTHQGQMGIFTLL